MQSRVSNRYYINLIFILFIFLFSWQLRLTEKSIIIKGIPEESVRLRILANSNLHHDQILKLAIRDEIILNIGRWLGNAQNLNEARVNLSSHMSEISQLVGDQIRKSGYTYTYQVELAKVPFPSKYYGNLEYPAGDYESLRVSIGKSEGENWWCVLFPPLCFVDTITGKNVKTSTVLNEKSEKNTNRYVIDSNKNEKKTFYSNQKDKKTSFSNNELEPKRKFVLRFLIWEKFKKWFYC